MAKNEEIQVEDSLAVKYRPTKLSDIIGNKTAIDSIKGNFKRRKLVKTWLISGPYGSGKTTLARLIAMTINCQNLQESEPCGECSSCNFALKDRHPDIRELNASGEQGNVDEMRRIIQQAKLKAKFSRRVFILDEIQGASPKVKEEMLKPLEEPPPSTVWLLCTTNPEKLSNGIYSRCHKIFFNYPTAKAMSNRLLKIAKKEYDSSLVKTMKPYMRNIADGCMCKPRESISAMEQVANAITAKEKITKKKIDKLVSDIVSSSGSLDADIIKLLSHLFANKKLVPLDVISKVEESRTEEFVNMVHRYAHYSALRILYNKKGTNQGFPKQSFYGINFIRIDKVLSELKEKHGIDDEERPLKLCSAAVDALEKSRLGIISNKQVLLYLVQRYFN